LIRVPFELEFLATNPRGSLIDVGCGGGVTLALAKQMGWQVSGLDLDPLACKAANNIGLNVIQGDYTKLSEISEKFDCVLCSHVLEHVHNPVEMLSFLTASLKNNGYLILSLPNANSDLRLRFGKFWRGLEAPRHISIPTTGVVISMLKSLGYADIKQYDLYEETYWQSLCIERKESLLTPKNFILFKLGRLLRGKKFTQTTDYIQLIAKKI
jgi:SAM-dependent methyltransferase